MLPTSDDLPPVALPPARVTVRQGARDRAAPIVIALPGSKYATLRYLLVALLADGESVVQGPALSDDTAVLVRAMRALGATVRWERTADGGWAARVTGCAGRLSAPAGGVLQMGNAGAVLRLLLGLGALLPEVRFATDHPESLGRRPNADLLDALAQLGVASERGDPDGALPIRLHGGPPEGGAVSVSGARSSQYLSALLYLAPLLPRGLAITVTDDLRSAPFIRATLAALALAGIRYEAAPDLRHIVVPGGQTYRAGVYRVPGDAPSAAALAAAAVTLDVAARLEGLDATQEDAQTLVAALHALGAPVALADGALIVERGVRLHGARIDGDTCIDSVPALAAAACFAQGETRFERVGTLRLKESDRISDLCAELRCAGASADPQPESIFIQGQPDGVAGGALVDAHDDHRLAQALAIVALRARDGLIITGANAIAKSYPDFFADLARLGAYVSSEG